MTALKKLDAHIWEREVSEHYVEPEWCSRRLFQEEEFIGTIHDPCCGFGTIPKAAMLAGLRASGNDLHDRGYGAAPFNFFEDEKPRDNIVCNPPFNIASKFAAHALVMTHRKVAMIFPTARLNAAHWVQKTWLKTVWLLTPRPSMPPGHVIAAGEKPGGGKMDFCWLVWERNYSGNPELKWLRRDK